MNFTKVAENLNHEFLKLNCKLYFDRLTSLITISSLHQVIWNKTLLRLPTHSSRYGGKKIFFCRCFKYFRGDSCNWKFERRKELLSKNWREEGLLSLPYCG